MLTITDTFNFNALGKGLESFDKNIRIRRIESSKLMETLKNEFGEELEYKSIVSTKKASVDFTKLLGFKVNKFSSTIFDREDFMTINSKNSILYGLYIKVTSKDKGYYQWYLVSMGV